MAQTAMYKGINNSPSTTTSASLTATANAVDLADASKLPAAPNLATLGTGDSAEVVAYGGKTGNTLTGCTRGFGGTLAQVWPTGTAVARMYTAYDQGTFVDNINDLNTAKMTATGDASNTTAAFTEASSRVNITTGGKLSVLFGAIKKWLTDLKDPAFATFGTGSNQVATGDHTHTGYLTAETDPTVSAWAKAATKPAYTSAEVGAVPTTRKINNKALSADISLIASDVGAVPDTRTINGKALTGNLVLSAADVSAVAESDMGAANGVATLVDGVLAPSQRPPGIEWPPGIDYDYFMVGGYDGTDVTPAWISPEHARGILVARYTKTISGTSYTIVQDDYTKVLEPISSSTTTITLPDPFVLDIPAGAQIQVVRYNGAVTFAPATDVTLKSRNNLRSISAKDGVVWLMCDGGTEWRLYGDLA